jgi:hypothetical protein
VLLVASLIDATFAGMPVGAAWVRHMSACSVRQA